MKTFDGYGELQISPHQGVNHSHQSDGMEFEKEKYIELESEG